nr:MAG TPA: hypothetical protein [Caudoviricetes sp.]
MFSVYNSTKFFSRKCLLHIKKQTQEPLALLY